MITCTECQKEFEADYAIGYPGHIDAPGSYIAKAVLCGYIAIGCGIASFFIFHEVFRVVALAFVVGSLISLVYIPQARIHCERSGGGVCSACGHKNKVKWNA
jgi:hypothetical protein